MRRLFTLSLLLLGLLLLAGSTHADMLLLGAGKKPSSSPAYQGPLDCTGCPSAANALAWYDLRCSTSAYTGNVIDVYAPLDASHTLVTCSTGGVLNETLQSLATTCAVSCTVKTWYDQIGGSCGDATQATEANRPTFQINAGDGKWGLSTAAATTNFLESGACSSQAQPFMVAWVGNRPSFSGGATDLTATAANEYGFDNANNKAYIYIGGASVPNAVANDNAWHFVQNTANGASSEIYVDGSGTAAAAAGSNAHVGATRVAGGDQVHDVFKTRSVGIGNSGTSWTSGQKTAIDTNTRTYWGF